MIASPGDLRLLGQVAAHAGNVTLHGELIGRFGRSTYLLFDAATGEATVREL